MRSPALQVMTANRLTDGVVVYLAPKGHWVEHLDNADTAADTAHGERLQATADAAVQDRLIVGPYLFAVERSAHNLLPLSQRERIRSAGPTVGTDLPATNTGD